MKRFIRNKENFVCLHCDAHVSGNGYTNHCPKCLWSRHVDVNPGDRQNTCTGMMRPVRLEMEHGEFTLIHQCETCGMEKRVKTQPEDDFSPLLSSRT